MSRIPAASPDSALLLLRLGVGVSMTYHGFEKFLPLSGEHGVFTGIVGFCGFVTHLGMPAFMGVVSILAEFVGGLCLLTGVFTRIAALMIAINMFVALFTVNLKHGLNGSEYTMLLIIGAFALMLGGPGRYRLAIGDPNL